jgi:hypothetical protein
MTNVVKWGEPMGTGTALYDAAGSAPTLKNLASGSGVLSNEVDNGTLLNRLMSLMLDFRQVSTGGTSPIEVYLVPCYNGTNYADSTPSAPQLIGRVQPASSASAQRLPVVFYTQEKFLFLAPNCKFKIFLKNTSGQAFTNTDGENQVTLFWANEELQ